MNKWKRLTEDEIKKIIAELKANNKYEEYREMIADDFEEHRVVYNLPEDEIIATSYVNDTIPYKMLEFYDWFQMDLLTAEDLD